MLTLFSCGFDPSAQTIHIFIHIYPHRFPAFEGLHPASIFVRDRQVHGGGDGEVSTVMAQILMLILSFGWEFWKLLVSPFFAQKMVVKLLSFFAMMTSSVLKSWCFRKSSYTRMVAKDFQGSQSVTDQRIAGCHIMSWQGHCNILPTQTMHYYYEAKSPKLPYISIVWSSPHGYIIWWSLLDVWKKACPQANFFWDDFSTWSESKKKTIFTQRKWKVK